MICRFMSSSSLKQASLFITHGSMNSVSESMLHDVLSK